MKYWTIIHSKCSRKCWMIMSLWHVTSQILLKAFLQHKVGAELDKPCDPISPLEMNWSSHCVKSCLRETSSDLRSYPEYLHYGVGSVQPSGILRKEKMSLQNRGEVFKKRLPLCFPSHEYIYQYNINLPIKIIKVSSIIKASHLLVGQYNGFY